MDEVRAAVEAIERGDLLVFPTDTVYGLAARPDAPEATRRLFEAKRRPRELELPVLVSSAEDVFRIAVVSEGSRRLMERLWPGALTIVLPRAEAAAGWDLGGSPATVGVRMPAHEMALSLLRRSGPLAVTSANLSGAPTPATCEDVREVFGDLVAVYLCSGEPLEGAPSTVVDLTGSGARVLRTGAVPESAVQDALAVR
jgi:L-threonylcarbamoyladenylate synthase